MAASDPIERFRLAARNYCEVIDSVRPGQELEELVRAVHPAVAEVYAAALALLPLPVGAEDPDVARQTNEDWARLKDGLESVLGDEDLYYKIWDLDGTNPESVVEGSLADDLAGTYRDLHDGHDAGETPDAVFQWQLGLASHWGRHAANAIRELQLLREREGWFD